MSLRLFCATLCALLVTSLPPLAGAQSPAACTADESKQFDFWVGHWRGSWVQDGQTKTALNVVTRSHDGCVITEQFREEQLSGLIGTSVSVWNPRNLHWQQTWVDNQGSYLAFIGGIDKAEMTLSREIKRGDGKTLRQRMRFTEVTPNRFVWIWEQQLDDEKSWSVQWRIEYARIEAAPTEGPLAQFHALAGCWASVQKGSEYREQWMQPAGGVMLGIARSIRDGKTISSELKRIERDGDGTPIYIATLKSHRETRARLVKHDAQPYVFESAARDAPTRVIYEITKKSLKTRIHRTSTHKNNHIEYLMNRVDCP